MSGEASGAWARQVMLTLPTTPVELAAAYVFGLPLGMAASVGGKSDPLPRPAFYRHPLHPLYVQCTDRIGDGSPFLAVVREDRRLDRELFGGAAVDSRPPGARGAVAGASQPRESVRAARPQQQVWHPPAICLACYSVILPPLALHFHTFSSDLPAPPPSSPPEPPQPHLPSASADVSWDLGPSSPLPICHNLLRIFSPESDIPRLPLGATPAHS